MDAKSFYNTMRVLGEPTIPDGADKDTLFGSYARVLGRFKSSVLQLAADNILDRRTYRNFPLPSECLQACEEAQGDILRALEATGRFLRTITLKADCSELEDVGHKPSVDVWSEYRIRRADRMMNSDIGRRAAKEGWIIGLHDFCREQDRLPYPAEATHVRLKALDNRRIRSELMEKHTGKTLPAVVVIAGKAMAAKADRLAEIAQGRDAA